MKKTALRKLPPVDAPVAEASGVRLPLGKLISLYESGAIVTHLIGMAGALPDIRRIIVTAARKGYDDLIADAVARYAMLSPVEASPLLKALEALADSQAPDSKQIHRARIIAEIKSDAPSWRALGRKQSHVGRFSDAFDSFEQACAQDAEHSATLQAVFTAGLRSGDQKRAASIYRAMLDRDPGDVRLSLRLAHALQRSEKGDEARGVLDGLDDARLRRFRDFDLHDVRVFHNAGHTEVARYAAHVIAADPADDITGPLPCIETAQHGDMAHNGLSRALAERWRGGAEDWSRRAVAGERASQNILARLLHAATNGEHRRFPAEVDALIDRDSLKKTRAALSTLTTDERPVVLLSAHIGPTMMTADNALQTIPRMRYFSAQHIYGFVRGCENFIPKGLDNRKQGIAIYNAITRNRVFYTSADLDVCNVAPKRKITLLGRPAYLPLSMPDMIFRTRAQAFWYAATWRNGKIAYDLERGPCVTDHAHKEDWLDAWLGFYAERIERALLDAPENYRACLRYMLTPPKSEAR